MKVTELYQLNAEFRTVILETEQSTAGHVLVKWLEWIRVESPVIVIERQKSYGSESEIVESASQ